jgi:streptogramin lyase
MQSNKGKLQQHPTQPGVWVVVDADTNKVVQVNPTDATAMNYINQQAHQQDSLVSYAVDEFWMATSLQSCDANH